MPAHALRAIHAQIEKGWSQDAHARDGFGERVPLGSDEAISWTLCGAFALAANPASAL